jgi:transcriptional regulator with XRE-family HTH domain
MSTELLGQVKQLRLDEDLTYAELAEQIGIDAGALHRILNGRSEPFDRTLFKIQKFIEMRNAAKRPHKRRAS